MPRGGDRPAEGLDKIECLYCHRPVQPKRRNQKFHPGRGSGSCWRRYWRKVYDAGKSAVSAS